LKFVKAVVDIGLGVGIVAAVAIEQTEQPRQSQIEPLQAIAA